MRLVVLSILFALTNAAPALSWWQYAEWGLSRSQLVSASGGRAMQCQAGIPVCDRPPGGAMPALYVESFTMIGMPASASFAFDGEDRLNQTAVFFPGSGLDLVTSLMRGIHGSPVDEAASPKAWHDARRGSIITAISAAGGAMLIYRPRPAR